MEYISWLDMKYEDEDEGSRKKRKGDAPLSGKLNFYGYTGTRVCRWQNDTIFDLNFCSIIFYFIFNFHSYRKGVN